MEIKTSFLAKHFTEQVAACQMTEFIRLHLDYDVLECMNPDFGNFMDGVGSVGGQTVFPIGDKFYVVDRGREGRMYIEVLREVLVHQVQTYSRPKSLRRGSVMG